MNILYITRKYPPSIGGMQTQSYYFYSNLCKYHNVKLISWGGSQYFLPFFLIFAGIRAVVYLIFSKIEIIQLGDLVLSPLGYIFKVIFNKPVLSVSHGRDSVYKNFIYDRVILRSAKNLNKIICVSSDLKNTLESRGFKSGQLAVIPNGVGYVPPVQTSAGYVDSLVIIRSAYGVDLTGKKIILSVSRLVAKKGINDFIEDIFSDIAKSNKQVLFLVAGDGPEMGGIKDSVNTLGLKDKVFLVGYVKQNSPAYSAFFQIADVFVMPNIKIKGDAEGFGIAALEAGIRGIPVVAYSVDGITEAIQDGKNGVLVPAGDTAAFKNRLLEFLENKPLSREYGEKSKKYIQENFGWDRIVNKYTKLYSELLVP